MRIIITNLAVLLLTSCANLKPNLQGYSEEIDSTNFKSIEGIYHVFSFSSLLENYHFDANHMPDSNDYFQIKHLKKTNFKFLIFDNGKVIEKKKLRGKLINGALEFSITKVSPFYVLINGVHNNRFRFHYGANDDSIYVDFASTSVGFLGFLPFTGYRSSGENRLIEKIKLPMNN